MNALRLQHVSKNFNGQPVLRDVNLAVPPNSVVALLGPSGCGKTTVLRLVGGFDRVDDGEIAIGPDIVAAPHVHVPPERRRVGYVPQEGALFPHLTVAGNVGYGLPRRERNGTRVAEVLHLTGLDAFGARFPHQLSGGQQQRAALARALAPKPALLLLDEPFNALDLDLRRRVCEEVIGMLRREGATAILVTHDPVEAFSAADLVAVMHDGRIIQTDHPDAVYRQPVNAAVARLTGQAVFIDGTFQRGQVLTALGLLTLHPAYARDAGNASVMLRPEQIIAATAHSGTPARVIGHSFRGGYAALTVTVDGHTLRLRAPSLSAPAPGSDIQLHVEGACAAFPVDG
jgi:iron(III) transport system ATP-binding protein